MNGYQLQADSYRQYLEQYKDTPPEVVEHMNREIKVNDMLASLTKQEIMMIFDTGAYNEVLQAYCYKAMEMAEIPAEKLGEVRGNIKYLLDTVGASEIITKD
jgi:hypothetical protein